MAGRTQALAREGHLPGAKQVFRDYAEGEMPGDRIGRAEEQLPGRPLLFPFVRNGLLIREETIE